MQGVWSWHNMIKYDHNIICPSVNRGRSSIVGGVAEGLNVKWASVTGGGAEGGVNDQV